MLTYRRQRYLSDLRDPARRSGFSSRESFIKLYNPGALPVYREKLRQRREAKRAAREEAGLPRTASYEEEDDDQELLTDAETRQAAEGAFWRQRLKKAREEEERTLAEEQAAAEAKATAERVARHKMSMPDLHGRDLHGARHRWRSSGTQMRAAGRVITSTRALGGDALAAAPARSVSLPAL